MLGNAIEQAGEAQPSEELPGEDAIDDVPDAMLQMMYTRMKLEEKMTSLDKSKA